MVDLGDYGRDYTHRADGGALIWYQYRTGYGVDFVIRREKAMKVYVSHATAQSPDERNVALGTTGWVFV